MALASVTYRTVVGKYVDPSGNPLRGQVEFKPNVDRMIDQTDNAIIYPARIVAELDNTGSFSVSLMISNDPDVNPGGWNYQVTEKLRGSHGAEGVRVYNVAVTSTGAPAVLKLAELDQTSPQVASGTVYVASVNGASGVVTVSLAGLGAGNSAVRNVGTTNGTVAAGDDSRIVGALPKAGGTMTGDLVLAGPPTANLNPASKAYTDSGDADSRARANHTGTQSADTLTDGTTNKAFLATERTKLAGVATGATANATDAQLRDRSTHTGTQLAATISDFDTQVRTSRLDQLAAPTGTVSFNGQRAVLLGAPTASTDAATKGYVDTALAARDQNTFRPGDAGLVGWSQDPMTCASTASTALTAGVLYLVRIPTRNPVLISGASVMIGSVGSAPTTVELSLFSPNGTRRAVTGNEAANWATSGRKSPNFGAAYTTDAGDLWHWVGILVVGGSGINLIRGSSGNSVVQNPGYSVSTARFANNGTALTATPASITPANNNYAGTGEGWWAALS